MRGSVREVRPGYWLARVDAGRDPLTGRRNQLSKCVRGSEEQAYIVLTRLWTEAGRGVPRTGELTLSELAELWLASPGKSGRRRTASSVYKSRGRFNRYVQPTLGHRSIGELRSSDITLLCDALMARLGLSPRTVSHVRAELRAMLGWAWKRELVAENVAIRADVPSSPLSGPTTITCEELAMHLKAAAALDSDLELMMLVAASFGLRRSELAALRWRHVDLVDGVLHIRESVTKCPGSDFETSPTKTGHHGFADFPIAEGLLELLRIRRDRLEVSLELAGLPRSSDGYIFSSDPLHRKPLHPDTITGALAKHRRRHPELPPLTIQMLRRYAASDMYGAGDDQAVAAAVLRDTPETTARHYRAVRRGEARRAVLGIYGRIEAKRATFKAS